MPKGRPRMNDERVVELSRQGATARQISEVMGCHRESVTRVLRRNGLTAPPAPPLTDEEVERARRVIEDGGSLTEAARTIGRSRRAIRSRFPDAAWTRTQIGQHRAMLRKLGGVL